MIICKFEAAKRIDFESLFAQYSLFECLFSSSCRCLIACWLTYKHWNSHDDDFKLRIIAIDDGRRIENWIKKSTAIDDRQCGKKADVINSKSLSRYYRCLLLIRVASKKSSDFIPLTRQSHRWRFLPWIIWRCASEKTSRHKSFNNFFNVMSQLFFDIKFHSVLCCCWRRSTTQWIKRWQVRLFVVFIVPSEFAEKSLVTAVCILHWSGQRQSRAFTLTIPPPSTTERVNKITGLYQSGNAR